MTNLKDLKPLKNVSPPHPKLCGAISRLAQLSELPASTTLGCIVKVHDKHVPKGASVRTNIGVGIFTADIAKENLESVLNDPLVISVSVGRKIFPAT